MRKFSYVIGCSLMFFPLTLLSITTQFSKDSKHFNLVLNSKNWTRSEQDYVNLRQGDWHVLTDQKIFNYGIDHAILKNHFKNKETNIKPIVNKLRYVGTYDVTLRLAKSILLSQGNHKVELQTADEHHKHFLSTLVISRFYPNNYFTSISYDNHGNEVMMYGLKKEIKKNVFDTEATAYIYVNGSLDVWKKINLYYQQVFTEGGKKLVEYDYKNMKAKRPYQISRYVK